MRTQYYVEATDVCATIIKHYVIKTEVLLTRSVDLMTVKRTHTESDVHERKRSLITVKKHLASVP